MTGMRLMQSTSAVHVCGGAGVDQSGEVSHVGEAIHTVDRFVGTFDDVHRTFLAEGARSKCDRTGLSWSLQLNLRVRDGTKREY